MRAALALALAGCLDRDPSWQVRVGVAAQTVARADLGVVDDTELAPGDVWVSVSPGYVRGDEVAYPIVGAGPSLAVASPFDPTAEVPRGATVFGTMLSKDPGGDDDHPDVQYAPFALVIHGPRAVARQLPVELEVPVGRPCDPPPDAVRGTFAPCADGCSEHALVRAGDGAYLVGPLHVSIDVLPQDCVTR